MWTECTFYLGGSGLDETEQVRQPIGAQNEASYLGGNQSLIQREALGKGINTYTPELSCQGAGELGYLYSHPQVICKDAPRESLIPRHFNRQSRF